MPMYNPPHPGEGLARGRATRNQDDRYSTSQTHWVFQGAVVQCAALTRSIRRQLQHAKATKFVRCPYSATIMATATVSSKGQITIPAQVRASLGLRPGDRVDLVEIVNGQFAIVVVTQSVKRLKGMIRKPQNVVSIEDMTTAVAAQGAGTRR
jgi:antitoxin PrlF